MRYYQLLESSRATVFHNTLASRVVDIFKSGRIKAMTRQDVHGLGYVSGVSTTRSFDFATGWHQSPWAITLELDLDTVRNNNKVVPIDFWYNAKDHRYKRKESEEFVVGSIDITRTLVGIHMSEWLYSSLKDEPAYQQIMNDPRVITHQK